jgi:hypothetical protein
MDKDLSSQLIGRWVSDPSDVEALEVYGKVALVFGTDGSLRYILQGEQKDEIAILTYGLENGTLVTNQPSSRGEDRTPFRITPDGKLILKYGEIESRYVKESSPE